MSERKLHIVHTEASVGWGGQEIRILSEARGMLARGHKVTLLCPAQARIYAEAQKQGIPVEALPIGRKKLAGMLAMRKWLKQHPVDVINTHSSTDSWLAALACATLRHAPAIVRTRHISTPTPNNRARSNPVSASNARTLSGCRGLNATACIPYGMDANRGRKTGFTVTTICACGYC